MTSVTMINSLSRTQTIIVELSSGTIINPVSNDQMIAVEQSSPIVSVVNSPQTIIVEQSSPIIGVIGVASSGLSGQGGSEVTVGGTAPLVLDQLPELWVDESEEPSLIAPEYAVFGCTGGGFQAGIVTPVLINKASGTEGIIQVGSYEAQVLKTGIYVVTFSWSAIASVGTWVIMHMRHKRLGNVLSSHDIVSGGAADQYTGWSLGGSVTHIFDMQAGDQLAPHMNFANGASLDNRSRLTIMSLSGTQGPPGPQGPPGSGGGAGGGFYLHVQDVPLATWTITHNLGMKPNVTTLVNFGTLVEAKGEIVHTSTNQVKVTFATPVTGQALLS